MFDVPDAIVSAVLKKIKRKAEIKKIKDGAQFDNVFSTRFIKSRTDTRILIMSRYLLNFFIWYILPVSVEKLLCILHLSSVTSSGLTFFLRQGSYFVLINNGGFAYLSFSFCVKNAASLF